MLLRPGQVIEGDEENVGYNKKYFSERVIQLDDEYWVKVRPLTEEQESQAQVALFGPNAFEGDLNDLANLRAKLNHRAYGLKQLELAILEWNIDEDDGTVRPINPDTLAQLSPTHSQKLLAGLREVVNPFEGKKQNDLG